MSFLSFFGESGSLQRQIDELTLELHRTKNRNTELEKQLDQMRQNNNTYDEVKRLKKEISTLRQSKMQLIRVSALEIERLRSFIRLMGGLDSEQLQNGPSSQARRSAVMNEPPDLSQPTISMGRSQDGSVRSSWYERGSLDDERTDEISRTDSHRSYDERKFTAARHERQTSLNSIRKMTSTSPQALSVKDRIAHLNANKNESDSFSLSSSSGHMKHHSSSSAKRRSVQVFEEAVDELTSHQQDEPPDLERPNTLVIRDDDDVEYDSDSPPPFGGPQESLSKRGPIDLPARTPSNTVTDWPPPGVDNASGPKSFKERMAAYGSSVGDIQAREDDRLASIKKARELDGVKISTNRAAVAGLFQGLVDKKKTNAFSTEANDIDEKNGGSGGGGGVSMKAAMANPTPENSVSVMANMNFFRVMPDEKKIRKKGQTEADDVEVKEGPLELLNMNNQNVMERMSEKEKVQAMDMICQGIVSNSELKQVRMCNAGVNDAFFIKILDALSTPEAANSQVTELWFESNDIRDAGFTRLAQFVRENATITTIKLMENKRDISTPVCDALVEAMKENHTILKFVYTFRFTHQNDGLQKVLRRNNDEARKRRVAERKRLEAMNAS